jgi:hypothetical protein
MLPAMHLLFPVRLAVRAGDSVLALRILDAPFEGEDTDGPTTVPVIDGL